MKLFRHVDGRIMKRTEAGGTGGGVTSHFDELATAEEAAQFARDEHVEAKVSEAREDILATAPPVDAFMPADPAEHAAETIPEGEHVDTENLRLGEQSGQHHHDDHPSE